MYGSIESSVSTAGFWMAGRMNHDVGEGERRLVSRVIGPSSSSSPLTASSIVCRLSSVVGRRVDEYIQRSNSAILHCDLVSLPPPRSETTDMMQCARFVVLSFLLSFFPASADRKTKPGCRWTRAASYVSPSPTPCTCSLSSRRASC